MILGQLQQWQSSNIEVDMCTVGGKAAGFFANMKVNLIGQISKLGDTPHQMDIVGVIKIMLDAFSNGSIDQLYVINNEFVNTMTERAGWTLGLLI
jgi:F-type H+-transporting ATPase subunit gamma